MPITNEGKAFNVSNFQGAISKQGLQSPNKFLIEIDFPLHLLDASKSGIENLNESNVQLYCESASIAGRSLLSTVDRQYGRNKEVVYNAPTYPPITLSFYCSEGLKEKQLFDRWNEYIVNSANGYDVAYYKDYTRMMAVKTLDRTGKISHVMTYHESYPKTISAVELNHNTTNATARLTVEMQYSWWEHDGIIRNNKSTVINSLGR